MVCLFDVSFVAIVILFCVYWFCGFGFLIPFLLFQVDEKMGNAESNTYRNHLSRFLPEEQSDIDGVFDTLSGLSVSAGTKNGKATKKTVTLAALKARKPVYS